VDGRRDALQHRAKELVDLFWVTVGQEFHGALEVGEQHRDLLALAFQGTAGRENLFGQIGGRVGEQGVLEIVERRVAYLLAADKYFSLLQIRLDGGTQPAIRSRNPFSRPYLARLACF
jgi:hypothetical protein